MMKLNRTSLQKIALALSIIVVLNLFFNVGIGTFYTSPKFEDFCGVDTKKYYGDEDSCKAVGGEWVAYGPYPRPVRVVEPASLVVEETKEYCDAQATCRKNFDAARDLYNRNVFIALVVLGTISVGAGIFLSSVSAISSGFLYGGLLSFLIGSMRYWSDMNEYLRFVILGLVLIALIWVGYKKLKD